MDPTAHGVSASNACGKVAHPTRRVARRVAALYPTEHLRPYRCAHCHWWHLGHLPPAVVRGIATADEIYHPREVTQ